MINYSTKCTIDIYPSTIQSIYAVKYAFISRFVSVASISINQNLLRMKQMKRFLMAGILTITLASCGAFAGAPVLGTIYTDVQAPLAVTSNQIGSKVGTGKATSILGIIATGDASINSAAKRAGISKISHIDYNSKSILGIFATWEVIVYGE